MERAGGLTILHTVIENFISELITYHFGLGGETPSEVQASIFIKYRSQKVLSCCHSKANINPAP